MARKNLTSPIWIEEDGRVSRCAELEGASCWRDAPKGA